MATIFGVLTILAAGIGLLGSTDKYMSHMMFFLGASILSLGLDEAFNEKKSLNGVVYGVFSIMIFIVLI